MDADEVIAAVREADHSARASANATLQAVAAINAVKAAVADLNGRVTTLTTVEQDQARAMTEIAGALESVLPEISTRLEGVAQLVDIARKEIRDVAQVVVGQGEGHTETLKRVQVLAQEARDAGRESSQVVKTLAAGGEERRSIAASLVRIVRTVFEAPATKILAVAVLLVALCLGAAGAIAVYQEVRAIKARLGGTP